MSTAQRSDQDQRDDQKMAATMWVTLSTQVIAATLAVIAVEGAFVTFVLDKQQTSTLIVLTTLFSISLFVFSIMAGGAGINKLTREGAAGNWGLGTAEKYFKKQTIACLIGFACFMLGMIIVVFSKGESDAPDVKVLNEKIKAQQVTIERISSDYQELKNHVRSLEGQVANPQPTPEQKPSPGPLPEASPAPTHEDGKEKAPAPNTSGP